MTDTVPGLAGTRLPWRIANDGPAGTIVVVISAATQALSQQRLQAYRLADIDVQLVAPAPEQQECAA